MRLLGNAPAPDVFAEGNTSVPVGTFNDYQWSGGEREEWGQSEWIETEPLLESTYTSIAFDDYDDDGCLDALALIDANLGGNTMITAGIALYHYDSGKEILELADYYPFGDEMNAEVKVPLKYFDVASQQNKSISVLLPYADPAAMENVSAAAESSLPIEYATRGTYAYGEGKIVLKKAGEEKESPALAEAVDNRRNKR